MALAAVAILASATPSLGAQRVIPAAVTMSDTLVANPVTGEIVVLRGGAAAGQIAVLDPASAQVRTASLGSAPQPNGGPALQVDPFRNRAYVQLTGGSLVALDLASLAVTPVASGIAGFAIDPGNDRIWAIQGTALIAIDGQTLGVAAFSAWPPLLFWNSGIGGFRVDPVAGTVHVAMNGYDAVGIERWFALEIGGSPLRVVGTSPVFSGWADSAYALEPQQRVVCFGRFAVTPLGGGCVSWPSGALSGLLPGVFGLLDLPGRSQWTAYNDGASARIYAHEYGVPSPWFNEPWNAGLAALNPATRRIYVSFVPPANPPELRSIDLDTGVWQPFGPPSATPARIGSTTLDVATNRVYWVGNLSYPDPIGIVEIDEPVAAAVPMTTAITPGTPTPNGSVTVALAATSAWTPFDHPVLRIFYQVDSIDGRWQRATPDGALAQVTITGLSPGPHTIHAFATDGQESLQPTMVVGPIASAVVVVPTQAACSNGADDDGDGVADFPADPGCQTASSALENPRCDDDLDNDSDGGIDWDGGAAGGTPDSYCAGTAWRDRESAPACGLGAELVLALAALVRVQRRLGRG